MQDRVDQEFELLKRFLPDVKYKKVDEVHWFLIPFYRAPSPWASIEIAICFYILNTYPGAKPYGFFVPVGLKYNGTIIQSTAASYQPPFEGQWCFLSWDIIEWNPKRNVHEGHNLWDWVRGFRHRLMEGP